MSRRVVMGSSALAVRIAESLADRRGSLLVVTDDEDRAETFLDAGIEVELADPADEAALASIDPPAVVAVVDADGERNLEAARAARQAFPEAHLVGYTGDEGSVDSAALGAVTDQVLDPGPLTVAHLLERAGDAGLQVRQLHRVLRGIDKLAVVTHDNPDPDAIASAIALARIARAVGCEVDVCYYGHITHQENRAFVNLLEYDLRNLDADEAIDEYDGCALVDHSRPGVNDQLPHDHPIDVVIDHHPPRYPVEAQFVDLRSDVGATSTLLVDYLESTGFGIPEDVATGLLFGIRVDTDEFTREVSRADFEAAATLLPRANLGLLERVESPSMSPETLDTIADAISNRVEEGSVLTSCVGRLSDRDALAQAADRLLTLEGVKTTLVFGVIDGTIYVSARSRGAGIDLGETLRDAFDRIGSAGGHADMAGAQITLGVLETVEDREESLLEVVEAVVTDRFMEALDSRSDRVVPGVFGPETDVADEYLVPEADRPMPAENDGDGDRPPRDR